MKNDVEKALDAFVGETNIPSKPKKGENSKEVVLNEREGLVERIDRIFVDSTGRQLLREQY